MKQITYKVNIVKQKLIKSGDIEINPSPMLNILEAHPPSHRRKYKTYFIPCTIKLQPKYQHIKNIYSSILKIDHIDHINATRNFPHLLRYVNQKRQYPTPQILFALIVTISPEINSCNHQLIRIPNPDWITILLEK